MNTIPTIEIRVIEGVPLARFDGALPLGVP